MRDIHVTNYPLLDPKERADAAMLFLFGTRGKCRVRRYVAWQILTAISSGYEDPYRDRVFGKLA